jgi:hypothetical protein
VYLPNAQAVLEHERKSARRVTERQDGSVVLAYASFVLDVPNSSTPFVPLEEWESAISELRAVPFNAIALRNQGGRIHTRLALWPETKYLRVVLTPKMLAASNALEADVFVSVSKSDGDAGTGNNPIPIRVAGCILDASTGNQIGEQHLDEPKISHIVESDAVLRQEKFELALNQVVRSMPQFDSALQGQRRVVIEYGTGHLGSGVVVTSDMLEQLHAMQAELLVSTVA